MPYQKGEGKSVVIALGGNALGNTPQEQLQLVKDTAKNIVDMVEEGTNVIVSHGNGPQVGMINNAFAYASANDGKTPEMPFPEAGAMSQGYIGYQLSQAILNDMKLRGIDRLTACVVTQTVVDPADPAFQNPTKPVGAFLSEEEAKAKAAETGWTFKEDAGRGWRQVVASPKPVRIVEFDAVKDLMDAGYIVVSTGGGGVPVFVPCREADGWQPDMERAAQYLTPRTKALVINTPNNPTGVCYSRPTLEAVARFARKNDLLVVADDIYTSFCYSEPFLPVLTLPGMKERTVAINSFSKNFVMTGFRVGNIVAPEPIARAVKSINDSVVYSAPAPSQRAALHALRRRKELAAQIVPEFSARMAYGAQRIRELPGFTLSLRNNEADYIVVEPLEQAG